MKQSQLLAPTLREAPAEAEISSHKLLLRSGMIRQTASGVYSFLPLGRRVLLKIERIIREEMDRIGAQETLLPSLQPLELWDESGRSDDYGPELMRLQDRHERPFALGPTHEEVITSLVRDNVQSYRQLPVTLYQISTKYRDERRPRFGVLRGREFIMKDAYSFSSTYEDLDTTYTAMSEAYSRIFTRLGLRFKQVEADAGTIGGSGETHEYMALADIGEDTIVFCTHCDYAANLEKARYGIGPNQDNSKALDAAQEQHRTTAKVKVHTPGVKTISELTLFLKMAAQDVIKTLLYVADGRPIAVLIRGDHEVNEIKLQKVLGAHTLELMPEEMSRELNLPVGYLGPYDLSMTVIADHAVAKMTTSVTGAGEQDYHYVQSVPGLDFTWDEVHDVRNAASGDTCPSCGTALSFERGIEVGHIFKLGTKYSDAMGASVLDQQGQPQVPIMGCYGIGVSRLVGAVAEQYAEDGMMHWPASIAPYHVHIIPVSSKDSVQMELANEMEKALSQLGLEILVDDRDERPGVKFKDADLFGIPLRIIVGREAADGRVECKLYTEAKPEGSLASSCSLAEIIDLAKLHLIPYLR
ncbi:proline--tRNA ligase [Paenibacillus shunpengii]|uniref:Proline--tRNA ligase n=1 Tax=Paenibacillus shunpengii TaxID=2054424 RepID=A0ABW5SI02_9BACL|nr:proline--tRNA ligase [Paenibacillus sp. FSL H7-0326]OMC71963.1 proline--tRNA ligase [Paenibacillus sp. FSL H7-0326]